MPIIRKFAQIPSPFGGGEERTEHEENTRTEEKKAAREGTRGVGEHSQREQ